MSSRRKRAATLFHTLALLTLVMVTAFAMAGSSLSQLNLSTRYAQRTQSDYIARAAMAEMAIRLNALPPPEDVTQPPPLVLEDHFQERERLLEPRAPLDATVTLWRERCRDNSSGLEPVAGHFDHGSRRSVPPFSLSLVYQVQMGAHSYWYESLIQRRWPYALTAPGPIQVLGQMNQAVGSVVYRAAASEVEGRVMGLEGDSSSGDGPPYTDREISKNLYESLFPFAGAGGPPRSGGRGPSVSEDRLKVGGVFRVFKFAMNSSGTGLWEAQFAGEINTVQALVQGGVDLVENVPSGQEVRVSSDQVVVAQGNALRGRVRKHYRPGGIVPESQRGRDLLSGLFRKSDTSGWSTVRLPAPGTAQTYIFSTVPQTGAEGVVVVPGIPTDGKCRLQMKPDKDQPEVFSLQRQNLILENVALSVEGNLNLEQCRLVGSNASLIVDGLLILENGFLDAGDNGLVIYCRDLIMKASGRFNGLIVAENGAAIYAAGVPPLPGGTVTQGFDTAGPNEIKAATPSPTPSPTPTAAPTEPELVIKGGLLVGGNRLLIPSCPGDVDPATGVPAMMPEYTVNGLTLVSTRIEYEPRYLRGLNGFGTYEVVATELRP